MVGELLRAGVAVSSATDEALGESSGGTPLSCPPQAVRVSRRATVVKISRFMELLRIRFRIRLSVQDPVKIGLK